MGGNAFKDINVIKMNKDEFEYHSNRVIVFLRENLNSEYVNILPYFSNKNSFSDIDIMICREDINDYQSKNGKSIFKSLIDHFDCPQSTLGNDDNLISIAVPIDKNRFIQLDLMPHSKNVYDDNLRFFAYNDLNILINRFISVPVFGAKFSPNGLCLNIYRDEKSKELLLGVAETKDKYYDYIDFLDLNVEQLKKGFNEQEEMYAFIFKSKYFDTSTMLSQIANLNVVERGRMDRPLYKGFISYVQNKESKRGIVPSSSNEQLFARFPEIKEHKKLLRQEYQSYLLFKLRFNFPYIKEILNGETSDNVKQFMNSFRKDRHIRNEKKLIEQVNTLSDEDFVKFLNSEIRKYNESKKINIKSKKRIF